jgi:release factor glutamine methyltransferase
LTTISESINEGAQRLRDASLDHERQTAGALLCHVLDVDRTHLLMAPAEPVGDEHYGAYLELIDRRVSGEPLQYIIGRQEFYGLDFKVAPGVLIPRPETEFLVEHVIKLSRERNSPTAPLIVDMGTGSGCIAIAVAVNLPAARVIATDISAPALAIAAHNAAMHGVQGRIEFVEGDLLAPLARLGLEHAVDFIATNPPYVPAPELPHLQREVREHEPYVALAGGPEGLNFYAQLLAECPTYLRQGGYLVCEIGYRQLESVMQMISSDSWQVAGVIEDLQGFPRTLSIRRA